MERDKLRLDFEGGKRIKVIAYELGRSQTAVNKYISRVGLKRNRKKSSQPGSHLPYS
jgi:DNA-binding NarL/FixJ family response regulator